MRVWLIILFVTLATIGQALTITKQHKGWTAGNQLHWKQTTFNADNFDLTAGTGKVWNIPVPQSSANYRNYSLHAYNGAAPWDGSTLRMSTTQVINGYTSSGDTYLTETETDFLQNGYTASQDLHWDIPMPLYLPHNLGDHASNTHNWYSGAYIVTLDVISQGTVNTNLGSFEALLARYHYQQTPGTYAYDWYIWETQEYGNIAEAMHSPYAGYLFVMDEDTPNLLPAFSATPDSGYAPLQVSFSDQSAGNPRDWEWDLDNDGVIDSNDQNPTYTYQQPGTYSVRLRLTGAFGQTAELVQTDLITVNTPELEIDFSADITAGNVPLQVNFSAQANGSVDTWAWDFEDDGTIDSTEQNPTHTFTVAQQYNVRLTATGPGEQATQLKTGYINAIVTTTSDITATPGQLSISPNPFNPTTTISFYSVAPTAVVSIFNLRGQQVNSYHIKGTGPKSITFNGTSRTGKPLPSGLYLARLTNGTHTTQQKLLLLK